VKKYGGENENETRVMIRREMINLKVVVKIKRVKARKKSLLLDISLSMFILFKYLVKKPK